VLSNLKNQGLGINLLIPVTFVALFAFQQTVFAESLSLVETEDQLTIFDGESLVLAYNKSSPPAPEGIDSVYERSGFLHPVCTPSGKVVTAMFPFDHAHQQGVFTAWVKTKYRGREIDFWNLAKGTGRVVHRKVLHQFAENGQVGFEVELVHRSAGGPVVDVLSEHWRVTAHPTDGDHRCFDLESVQSAITDYPLRIEKFHYGGMALRGPTRWLSSQDRSLTQMPDFQIEPSGFVNDLGSDRFAGNHQNAKWVSLWGSIDGKPASISVLCHNDNFRAPQVARLHPNKPYFCFAPCNEDEFVIDRNNPLQSRYRFLVGGVLVDF